MTMLLDQIEVGNMQNYAYFLGDSATREVVLIDPAWEVEKLMSHVSDNGYTLTAIIVTHAHPDHTNGLPALLERAPVPVYVSEEEAPFYEPIKQHVHAVKDGDTITIGSHPVQVLHTPGHSPGGICLYGEGVVLTGDTLFIDEIGRCDLPGGHLPTLLRSLKTKLAILPDDTIVYPGHRYHTKTWDTIGNQKKTNPYLK